MKQLLKPRHLNAINYRRHLRVALFLYKKRRPGRASVKWVILLMLEQSGEIWELLHDRGQHGSRAILYVIH